MEKTERQLDELGEQATHELFGVVEDLAWELDRLSSTNDEESLNVRERLSIRHAQNARAIASAVLLKYADALGKTVDLPWEEE